MLYQCNEYNLISVSTKFLLSNNMKTMCRPAWLSGKAPKSQIINLSSSLNKDVIFGSLHEI